MTLSNFDTPVEGSDGGKLSSTNDCISEGYNSSSGDTLLVVKLIGYFGMFVDTFSAVSWWLT